MQELETGLDSSLCQIGRCVHRMDHFCLWVGGAVSENNLKFFILFNSYRAGGESREWRFSLLSFYPRNIVAILNKIRALITSLSLNLNPLESHAKVA